MSLSNLHLVKPSLSALPISRSALYQSLVSITNVDL